VIVETWYGYCLAPQRSMALDAEWLEMVTAFAAKENISAMLTSDYGCFLQEGGRLSTGRRSGLAHGCVDALAGADRHLAALIPPRTPVFIEARQHTPPLL
jgi:hypothetical protein